MSWRIASSNGLRPTHGGGQRLLDGFGPVNVGLWRMSGALELGDHERAVVIAEGLRPEAHPNRARRAVYWLDYDWALVRVRGRYDDAVLAFHSAERSRQDAIGWELRGMVYRAGLPG